MPSGHASHKSTSTKPNTNTDGQINNPIDPESEQEVLSEGADALRAAEAPENQAATQRSEDQNSAQ